MRVYVVGVGVSCHHNFVTFEGSLGKLNCDLVSKLGSDIVSTWMRLNKMIVANAVSLAVHLTSILELLIRCGQRTVERRHIFFALSLIVATDVLETFLAASAVFGAYRCDSCHHITSFKSCPIISVTFLCSSRRGWKFTAVSLSMLASVAI